MTSSSSSASPAMSVTSGAMLSSTVTVAVAVAVLPLWSSAVMVTVTSPTSLQSNVVMSMAEDVTEQLSVMAATSARAMVAAPEEFSSTVMSIGVMVGATSSNTVTVAEAVAVLPARSVTVKVTVLSPRSSQSNSVGSAEKATAMKSSLEPSFSSSASMETLPSSSRYTVRPSASAVGSVLWTMTFRKAKMLACPQPSRCLALNMTGPSLNGPVSNWAYPLSTSVWSMV